MTTGTLTRRGIMKTLVAGSAIGALGACTVSSNGSVTSVTLNVAKVKAYATAGINAVSTILSVGAIATAVGAPTIAIINTAAAALEASLTAFSNQAGSSVTVSYDDANMKAAINSILLDLQTVTANLTAAVTGVSSKIDNAALDTASTVLSALRTVLSVFQGFLGSVSAIPAPMTETQALKTLRAA